MSFYLILPWFAVLLAVGVIIAIIVLLTARKSPTEEAVVDESSDTKFAVITTLCIVFLILLITGCYYAFALWAKPRRDNAMCMSNLKQMGAAVIMYSHDFNGYLPATLDRLMPYLGNSDMLSCPVGDYEYVFLRPVERLSEAKIPARTIIAYDEFMHTRGEDKRNVLYLDGHVEAASEGALINQLNDQEAKSKIREEAE